MSKEEMYITGNDAFKTYASQSSEDIGREVVARGQTAQSVASSSSRTFENWSSNLSVRSDYNRSDFEYFRPSYTVPVEQKQKMNMCNEAYHNVGLVHNVIDLMGDFGAQGIRLQHVVPSTQQFYNTWWEKIGGSSISERFLNLLYRIGQNVVRASYGKVSVYDERKWRKGKASEVELQKIKPKKREIPLKYTFMDVLSLEVLGKELAPFVGQPALALKITPKLKTSLAAAASNDPKISKEVRKMVERVPKDIMDAILKGQRHIPLDMERTTVTYYKKDDWEVWATPMIHSVMDDLLMLNKLKLADISALDGAISNIRLWTLGIMGDSPATSILPTKAGINKVRNILSNNVGGGVLDLVWGPELQFTESNSQVWRFLGSEKYDTTINAIYEGLGIPAPLRAGAGQSNTGNFIGLNTLVKRLQYGRDLLVNFWNAQLKYVHKAMGFPGKPPQVVFDFMALADEAAEKQLLVHLWDRDIISDQTILELFGRLPNIEKSRVKREMTDRKNEVMPYKASPYHNPDKEDEFRKILLQQGGVTPSEIGIDLQDRKDGEQTMLDKQKEKELEIKKLDLASREKISQQNKNEQMGTPGRPDNVKETKKRKAKPTEKPSTNAFVDIFLWANSAQENISEMVTKAILEGFGKTNLRSLSRKEFNMYEKTKLDILCAFAPFEKITAERVYQALSTSSYILPEILGAITTLKAQFISNTNREPKIEELRQIYSSAYALIHENS